LNDFLNQLETPKTVLLMIKSGDPVDQMITQLAPLLSKGDIIIDAGNSFYQDSIRRFQQLAKQGIEFVGMGVSGGEEGALKGPSIMPAGSEYSKKHLLPLLQKIAAVADGKACVNWMGNDGAGHFVKMIHNGIEYADMQLLSEIYAIGKHLYQWSNTEIADYLKSWKMTTHNSYLLDITIDILRFQENGESLLEQILDVAGHKGTGLWTTKTALDLGVPVPSITSAMNQRILSSKKALRTQLSAIYTTKIASSKSLPSKKELQDAFLFARLVALAEGFFLIQTASKHYGWKLDFGTVAEVWRGGCIIRSDMLKMLIQAFENSSDVPHLFAVQPFVDTLKELTPAMMEVNAFMATTLIPTPALSASFSYYKSMITNYLAINMIQAQRDYFGAHTYRKVKEPTTSFHTEWVR